MLSTKVIHPCVKCLQYVKTSHVPAIALTPPQPVTKTDIPPHITECSFNDQSCGEKGRFYTTNNSVE